ncbi:MAG: DUF1801 domain-containing protein [Gemmatimonadota bacterium]
MGGTKPSTSVATFLAQLPADRRAEVERVRDLVKQHLPAGYEEVVSKKMLVYQVPLKQYAETYNGQPLWYVALASEKSYLSLHLMPIYQDSVQAQRLKDAFQAAGKKLNMGKACIRFKTADDLPLDAIGAVVASTPLERWVQIALIGTPALNMRLTDDELRAVLARADTIQRSSSGVTDIELESFIQAAEEVGYTRKSVELALRERLGVPAKPPAVGDLTFAKSADDKFYVAQVLSSSDDVVRVRFMRGGEHTVPVTELRPCSFLPGERVVCQWPSWGPWTCTVVSYDAAAQRVKVSDGWSETREFPISEVWLNRPKKAEFAGRTRTGVFIALIGAGLGLGAVLGSIITALLLR